MGTFISMENNRLNEVPYSRLLDCLVNKISHGSGVSLLWGFTPVCVRLIGDLHQMGLSNYIAGVTDPDPKKQRIKILTHDVIPPEKINELEFNTLVVTIDEQKEDALTKFATIDTRKPDVILYGTGNYNFNDPLFSKVLSSLPVESKAGGYPTMLVHIFQSLLYIVKNDVPGDIAEFGTFQAGTTVFIAKILEELKSPKNIYAFDTFSGYPERTSVLDLFHENKCEFNDYEFVRRYCETHKIELVKGNIVENVHFLRGKELSFSFFDTDNYTPTRVALEIAFDNTPQGGIIAFDHYFSPKWPYTVGEKIAANEVLKNKRVFHLHGTGIFMKL
jgi:O-methyltransferase